MDVATRKFLKNSVEKYTHCFNNDSTNPLTKNKGYLKSKSAPSDENFIDTQRITNTVECPPESNSPFIVISPNNHSTAITSSPTKDKEANTTINLNISIIPNNNSFFADSFVANLGLFDKPKADLNLIKQSFQKQNTTIEKADIMKNLTAVQIAEQAYTKKQESSKINLYPELLKLEFLHKLVSDSLYVQQVEECKNYHLEGDSHELREKINKLTDSYQMLFARDLKRYDKSTKTLVIELHCTFLFISTTPAEGFEEIIASTQGKEQYIYVKFRPLFYEMIRELKMYYEIIIYSTVSTQFMGCINDFITKREGSIISHVLSSQHCVLDTSKGSIKSLEILSSNREINNMICIDSNLINYCLHSENAIPISRYDGTASGNEEMVSLMSTLKEIGECQNVNFVSLIKNLKI